MTANAASKPKKGMVHMVSDDLKMIPVKNAVACLTQAHHVSLKHPTPPKIASTVDDKYPALP